MMICYRRVKFRKRTEEAFSNSPFSLRLMSVAKRRRGLGGVKTSRRRGVKIRKQTEEESSGSAQVIAANDDLSTELLLRLPVKSLLKFKSVCKHWLSLVSDPNFIRRRNLESKAASALYLSGYSGFSDRYYEFVPLDPFQTMGRLEYLNFAHSPGFIEIEHSCKGLLLCRSVGEDKYFVYNPTTMQFKTLPPLAPAHTWDDDTMVWGLNLAFDPSISHLYKVVCILGSKTYDEEFEILIYSSETGCWRVSGAPFCPPAHLEFGTAAYFNGAIHWYSEIDATMYFDLDEEIVREMPMPRSLYAADDDDYSAYAIEWWRYFGESGGHLHLVDSYQHLTTHLDVYEMEQDRSGWFLKFRVDPDVLAGFTMPYEDVHLKWVLYVARGEKEEDSFLVVHISNNKVIRYNFISQTHQEIHDMNSRSRSRSISPYAYQYIESLSLV